MKKHLLLSILLFPLLLSAQDNLSLSVALIPPNLLPDANAVIRQQDVVFTVKSAGDAVLRERLVVTILNDKSYYSALVLHYNSFNKIGKVSGQVFNAAGQFVRDIEKYEIIDVSAVSDFSIYEDSRVRYVNVDQNTYPYTVVFDYEKTYRDLLTYPGWQVSEFGAAVQQASFTLDLPEGFDVEHKILNMAPKSSEQSSRGRRILRWDMENLPAVRPEPFCPPAGNLLPILLVSPHQFEAEKYAGSMATWKDLGLFNQTLMKGRDQLSPAMKATVHQLTANAASDQEKIDILYRYLQQNTRYVSVQLGIGGWQPFDAKYVETNKYGDCKALSNFMKAMLAEVGITAWPVLIYSGDIAYEVTEDFATPRFNHMILYVPAQDCWLECTSNTAPPNYLGASTAGRNVLLITDDGGVLARTPDLLPATNITTSEVSIRMSADGQASLALQSIRRGTKQDWYRYAVAELSRAELEKKFHENLRLPAFTFDNLTVEPVPNLPETAVHFKASVPRYASKSGKRLFVPLNAVNPFTDIPPADEDRQHPVVVRNGYTEEDQVTLYLPSGFRVESMPTEPVVLESTFGKYALHISAEADTVLVKRHLEILPIHLPASDYGAWRDFCKEIAKWDATKLVLVQAP